MFVTAGYNCTPRIYMNQVLGITKIQVVQF